MKKLFLFIYYLISLGCFVYSWMALTVFAEWITVPYVLFGLLLLISAVVALKKTEKSKKRFKRLCFIPILITVGIIVASLFKLVFVFVRSMLAVVFSH